MIEKDVYRRKLKKEKENCRDAVWPRFDNNAIILRVCVHVEVFLLTIVNKDELLLQYCEVSNGRQIIIITVGT